MRVIRASAMGICFGVRDALKYAEDVAKPIQVTVYGELVHNPLVNARMRRRGFRQSAERDGRETMPETPQVLVTAHGISQRRRYQLISAGKNLIDATCPLVKKAHLAAQRLQAQGYHVLIIGRRGHVEVQGVTEDLTSFDVISELVDVRTYPYSRLGIMCQTTTASPLAAEIRAAIAAKNPHAEIQYVDTICQPTKDRQNAIEDLLDRVHVVVVVGGENSNNTRLLAQRCRQRGVVAYHVQGAEDLNPQWFSGVDVVGLTAGTSTLPETIEEVFAALNHMRPVSQYAMQATGSQ